MNANPAYIQTRYGSFAHGATSMPSTEPPAEVRRKSDMMKDFMLGGAWVYAYSRPAVCARIYLVSGCRCRFGGGEREGKGGSTEAKISEKPMRR
jgi:hypothetical protein